MSKTKLPGQKRLRSLWTLLRWNGHLRNEMVRDLFGVKIVQASRLLADFAAENEASIYTDRSRRRYLVADEAAVLKNAGDISELLAIYRTAGAEMPEWFIDAGLDFSPPSPRMMGIFSDACESGGAVEIEYRSMSGSGIEKRVILPSAIIRLSQRWHIRAWCTSRLGYRDFNFGRIYNAKASKIPVSQDRPEDVEWDTLVDISVRAHSSLREEDSDVVRAEYFNKTMEYRFQARGALVKYLLQEARIAVDLKNQKPPEFLLMLGNPGELKPYLFPGDRSK